MVRTYQVLWHDPSKKVIYGLIVVLAVVDQRPYVTSDVVRVRVEVGNSCLFAAGYRVGIDEVFIDRVVDRVCLSTLSRLLVHNCA